MVEGELRRLTFGFLSNYELRFSWPAAAQGGVEVEVSGVMLSSTRPEYNLCFEGKAIVGKAPGGELFHLVASDDVTAANADGTCTETRLAGTAAFCVPNEL